MSLHHHRYCYCLLLLLLLVLIVKLLSDITARQLVGSSPTNWRQYLNFISLTGFFGGISGLLTRYRQYKLRAKTLARFRKQDDLDESLHTLIDMENLF